VAGSGCTPSCWNSFNTFCPWPDFRNITFQETITQDGSLVKTLTASPNALTLCIHVNQAKKKWYKNSALQGQQRSWQDYILLLRGYMLHPTKHEELRTSENNISRSPVSSTLAKEWGKKIYPQTLHRCGVSALDKQSQ
jgi:hypothetical protein